MDCCTEKYFIGTTVKLTAAFTDTAGAPIDPSVVTAGLRNKAGAITFPPNEIIRTGLGTFQVNYKITSAGEHWYRFEGDGASSGVAEESKFIVPLSRVL